MFRSKGEIKDRGVETRNFGFLAACTIWVLFALAISPCMSQQTVFEDDFSGAPFTAMAAARSHIYANDPVFESNLQNWTDPGGSSSGFPYWIVNDGDVCYLFENPHSLQSEGVRHYYSGIQSLVNVPLTRGRSLTVDLELKVNRWWNTQENRLIISKIQIDMIGRRQVREGVYHTLSFFTLLGPGGGYASIGLNDPDDTYSPRLEGTGVDWIPLSLEGWEWVPGRGVYGADEVLSNRWFQTEWIIDCNTDAIGATLFVIRGLEEIERLDLYTQDPRALAFCGDGALQLHMQTEQRKGPNEPERNFKMTSFVVTEEPITW